MTPHLMIPDFAIGSTPEENKLISKTAFAVDGLAASVSAQVEAEYAAGIRWPASPADHARAKKIASDGFAALTALHDSPELTQLRAATSRFQSKLLAATTRLPEGLPSDRVASILDAILRRFERLDEMDAKDFLRSAATRGEMLVVRAVRELPQSLRLGLTVADLATLTEIAARALDPETAKLLDGNLRMIDAIAYAFLLGERSIAKSTGVPALASDRLLFLRGGAWKPMPVAEFLSKS